MRLSEASEKAPKDIELYVREIQPSHRSYSQRRLVQQKVNILTLQGKLGDALAMTNNLLVELGCEVAPVDPCYLTI